MASLLARLRRSLNTTVMSSLTRCANAEPAPVHVTDLLGAQGDERKDWRKVRQLTMVQPDTPLTDVLKLLLDAGVSAVPVVDDKVRYESAHHDNRQATDCKFSPSDNQHYGGCW